MIRISKLISLPLLITLCLVAPTAAHATTIVQVGDATGTEQTKAVFSGTVDVTCNNSTLEVTVQNDGTGTIDDIDWTNCTGPLGACSATLVTGADFHITGVSGGGELTLVNNASMQLTCNGTTCTATAGTAVTAAITNSGLFTFAEAAIANEDVAVAGGPLCGTIGTWAQIWTIDTSANGADNTVTISEP
jgi:hypothetical protein